MKNELRAYFFLLTIGVVIISVIHAGLKYTYDDKPRKVKLVYKLIIYVVALSIIELPSIICINKDIENDSYISVSAQYVWQINSTRNFHHLTIYPDDEALGVELTIPSIDSNPDHIDNERFPVMEGHGIVWYSENAKYILLFEPDDNNPRS